MHRHHAIATAIASLAIGLAFAAPHASPKTKASKSGHQADLHRVGSILNSIRIEAGAQHDIWFNDGDFPRSVQSLKVLHNMFPADYQLLTDLGWMLENVHQEPDALLVYIQYAASYPEDPEAAYPEAEFYFRNKLFSKVPPIIEPSLKLKTHPHANSYRILARSYEKMGLFQDSRRIWDTYLAIDPNDGQAKLNRERVNKKLRTALR